MVNTQGYTERKIHMYKEGMDQSEILYTHWQYCPNTREPEINMYLQLMYNSTCNFKLQHYIIHH